MSTGQRKKTKSSKKREDAKSTGTYRYVPATLTKKMLQERHDALTRIFQKRVELEQKHIAEYERRMGAVHEKLREVFRNSAELKGVIEAFASLPKPERLELAALEKNTFAPKKPIVRVFGADPQYIHIDQPPPYSPDTWQAQTGSGSFPTPPTADGNTGNMSFGTSAGYTGSGSASCTAGVFWDFTIPSAQCLIEFRANPSFSWSYGEQSVLWVRTQGNIWIGQSVSLWDQNGAYLGNPIGTQNIFASWNDSNFSGNGSNSGSTSAYQLYSSLQISPEAEGGWISYGCMIGGSASSGGGTSSGGGDQIQANCNDLIVDITL